LQESSCNVNAIAKMLLIVFIFASPLTIHIQIQST